MLLATGTDTSHVVSVFNSFRNARCVKQVRDLFWHPTFIMCGWETITGVLMWGWTHSVSVPVEISSCTWQLDNQHPCHRHIDVKSERFHTASWTLIIPIWHSEKQKFFCLTSIKFTISLTDGSSYSSITARQMAVSDTAASHGSCMSLFISHLMEDCSL